MAIETYPDITGVDGGIPALIPLDYKPTHRILKTEFENGREARRPIWQSPRRFVTVKYMFYPGIYDDSAENPGDVSDAIEGLETALARWETFYGSVQGSLYSFDFYFPPGNAYSQIYAGTVEALPSNTIKLPSGYGVSSAFQTPNMKTSDWKLHYRKKGALSLIEIPTSSYSVSFGKQDSARFSSFSPSLGDSFFFTFTGRHMIKARLAEELQFSQFGYIYTSAVVNLVPLEPSLT